MWQDGIEFVLVAIALALFLTAIWCINDAFDHTDMGWVWVVLIVMFLPIAVPTYLIMRSYANRGPNAEQRLKMQREDNLIPKFRFANEIERAKFIEAAASGQGTMYEPEAGIGERPEGYAHFTDQKAEELLRAGRNEEAWNYLTDVYDVAQKEHDPLREDTYRHYISRLPEGLKRLREMKAAKERDPDRPQERRPEERSVPF